MAAARAHPGDQVLMQLVPLSVLHLAGFKPVAYGLYGAIVLVQNVVVHSNVDIGIGVLRWLVSSPDYHHWHHAEDRAAWNTNFAGQFPLVDKIFGTAYFPKNLEPSGYGIGEVMSENYPNHLLAPFRWTKLDSLLSIEDGGFPVGVEARQASASCPAPAVLHMDPKQHDPVLAQRSI